MNLKLSSVPYLSSFLHSSITVPNQWIKDIKFVEFNELLSSSVSALAIIFRWNKLNKSEFTEIASGMLSSSFVYGDPIGTISSIVTLGYAYSKTKNKDSLRKLKWASIRGAAGVAAFALSTKLISITILNILIGICAAAVVKKTIGIMRLWEYRFFLRNIKKYIPVLKKEMSRREFISLKIFTYKNA
tara:strand:+ start:538 stop:1098 length:561 start_codon:yes stop_codon:yes gene_type:complete